LWIKILFIKLSLGPKQLFNFMIKILI